MSSEGKVAVVTGGGAGIGKACVLRFVKEGMRVVFGNMSPEDGEKTCAMARDAGGDVLFCEGNVVNELDCQAWGQAALDAWGYIDILSGCECGGPRFRKHSGRHRGRLGHDH